MGGDDGPLTIRLGYFPNLTHAPALVGRDRSLRGATGYNLNGEGAEIVGQELARVIIARRSARAFRERLRLLRGVPVA